MGLWGLPGFRQAATRKSRRSRLTPFGDNVKLPIVSIRRSGSRDKPQQCSSVTLAAGAGRAGCLWPTPGPGSRWPFLTMGTPRSL